MEKDWDEDKELHTARPQVSSQELSLKFIISTSEMIGFMSYPQSRRSDIAVIGIGCRYPGASDPKQLWENILARRCQFRRLPNQRLPLADYYDPDPNVPDKTYGSQAAVIDGFEFDWVSRRIPKVAVEATDIVHWLALEVASNALTNSGYTRANVPTERSGVILGNTLTGEQTRASTMRLRWPYVQRSLQAAAQAKGLPAHITTELLAVMEQCYKSVFPPVTEDSLAGGLSNTIAGRICNFFNFHGGGYTVDGACSSSLIAIATAANALVSGDLDLALAGGVDVSLDTFEMVGFAKTGALTGQDMRVYDRRASGFIPGEGCGFVVLKRLEDARTDSNYVYAVLRGWGISSDGRGSITAPNRNGQATALKRAYARAGYGMKEVAFVEGHGTGTPVGDRTELEGIALALTVDGSAPPRSCGVTSFKSLVGHTKAAAGIGGFIKAVIAVNRRVIPPTAGCEELNPVFEGAAQCLYPVREGEIRSATETLRAGVSAMGFGGINCHVTLESSDIPSIELAPDLEEGKLLISNQKTELFVWSANSIADLQQRVEESATLALGISMAEMVDLAMLWTQQLQPDLPVRAAVIADSPMGLLNTLKRLQQLIQSNSPALGEWVSSPEQDIWLGNAVQQHRVGFLFPGQGSQQLNMARYLVERYDWARDLVMQSDLWLTAVGAKPVSSLMFRCLDEGATPERVEAWTSQLAQTEIAQPAICLTSLLWQRYLQKLGITPVAVGGHSLGELTAFYTAGAFDEKTLLQLAAVRGQAMSATSGSAGMVSLGCDTATAEALLNQINGYAVVANLNSPKQTVVSGEMNSLMTVTELANTHGISTHKLPVSNAFHSQLVASAAAHLRTNAPLQSALGSLSVQIFSSINGQPIAPGINLREHFANQVVSPVNFMALVQSMQQTCDLIVEVGSKRVLSGLVSAIANSTASICFPVESKPRADRDINVLLGNFFIRGGQVNWDTLYENRLVRTFIPATQRQFIENPCERPFPIDLEALAVGSSQTVLTEIEDLSLSPIVLQNDLSQRGKFLTEVIRADLTALPTVAATVAPRVATTASSAAREVSLQSQAASLYLPPLHASETNGAMHSVESTANSTTVNNARIDETTRIDDIRINHTKMNDIENNTEINSIEIDELQKRLLALIVKQTGYPKDSLVLSDRLLDDLNLDSIKAGEVIASFAKECGVAGKIDPAAIANATLQDIIVTVSQASAVAELGASVTSGNGTLNGNGYILPTSPVPVASAPAASGSTAIADLLLNLIEQRTGFPRQSLDLELRLLDDLNLDSIKAGEIVAEAAKEAGVAGQLDPSDFANAQLSEIAAALVQLKPIAVPQTAPSVATSATTVAQPRQSTMPAVMSQSKMVESPSWVRNFIVQMEPAPDLPTYAQTGIGVDQATMLILCEPSEFSLAQVLCDEFVSFNAHTEVQSFATARQQALIDPSSFTHFIVVLPRQPELAQPDHQRLQRMVDRLQVCAALPATPGLAQRTISYVQFGRGCFGNSTQVSSPEQCCATAFAASQHLEQSDLKVRVVDVDPAIDPAQLATCLMAELSTPESYLAVGYDIHLTRYLPKSYVQNPATYPSRNLQWSTQDVILVTGGAKGITAECALALAQAKGVRMALVGSSPHPQEQPGQRTAEIVQTLKRFKQAGIVCEYYCCDITDANAVMALVQQVQQELGAITGVIHGAAVNKPRRIDQVSAADAYAEVLPKVMGAIHLCYALQDQPPKLFVGFSSIIGVTGMVGNAWYGFSNEALNLIMRRFEAEHPETAVIAMAFSVWEEVGMGARMGSIRNLSRIGIRAIPTQEGVARFLGLVEGDPGDRQIVIAARLGGLDTWFPNISAKPTARFLETIHRYEPDVEVVARVHLSLETDLYLRDHLYRGSYLFPTVFGLEAMSQAVAYATGQQTLAAVCIEDIRLERPIVVSANQGVEIEIRVEVLEQEADGQVRRVRAGIGTEQTGFAIDHFSATFILSCELLQTQAPVSLPTTPLRLQPQQDLYHDGLLFQGALFQRIYQVYRLNCSTEATGTCVFGALRRDAATVGQEGFSPDKSMPLMLGDPFLRDALLQSVQLIIPQDICLPIRIDRLEITAPNHRFSGERTAVAVLEGREDKTYRSMVYVVDQTGQILERLSGYQLRVLEHHPENPTAQDLAQIGYADEVRLQDILTQLAVALHVTVPHFSLQRFIGLDTLSKAERHQQELPILQLLVQKVWNTDENGALPQIYWSETGKPTLAKATVKLDLSVSHTNSLLLCVAGSQLQGCDLELLTNRSQEEWITLLGMHRATLLNQLLQTGDPLSVAGMRIWSAVEAVRKATGWTGFIPLVLQQRQAVGVRLSCDRDGQLLHILTVPIALTDGKEYLAAFVVRVESQPQPSNQIASTHDSTDIIQAFLANFSVEAMSNSGPQGQKVFEHYFPLTFREDANLDRSVYFSNYAKWMGKIRELSMSSVFQELAEQFSTGEWGMVTNHSQTQVLGEAKLNNLIKARLWLGQVTGPTNSTLDLHYDWSCVLPNGGLERVATSEMRVTWVRILDHGIVEAKPFPPYFQSFVDSMVPQFEAATLLPTLPEPLTDIDLGAELYHAPAGPQVKPLLFEQTFDTGLEDANLVGNLYFANYYMWQGRVRDRAIYELYPDSFRGTGRQGQLRCLCTRVDHLREAMPFDPIHVKMSLRVLYEKGISLFFEYFRVAQNGRRHKLATGEQNAAWLIHDDNGRAIAVPLPSPIQQALRQAIAGEN